MIRVRDLGFTYDRTDRPAVHDLSFEIEKPLLNEGAVRLREEQSVHVRPDTDESSQLMKFGGETSPIEYRCGVFVGSGSVLLNEAEDRGVESGLGFG